MFKTLSCKEVEAQTRLTTTSPASPLNHTSLRCPVRHQTGHLTNNSWRQTTIVIIELYTFLVTWRWWIFWRICDLATRIFPRFKKFTYCAFNPHWLLVIFSFLLIGCCDFSGFGLTTFHRKQSKRDSYRLLLGNIHTDARGTQSSHFHVGKPMLPFHLYLLRKTFACSRHSVRKPDRDCKRRVISRWTKNRAKFVVFSLLATIASFTVVFCFTN